MSNLLTHAERELDLIGMTSDSDDKMNGAMRKHILHMVTEFGKEGHSGFSASYALSCLKKLLAYEPLSPLTGEDDEWSDVSEYSSSTAKVYQNKRASHVFKQSDRFDGQAYDVNGRVYREENGSCYTGAYSHTAVTFPYTPITEYIDVQKTEEI